MFKNILLHIFILSSFLFSQTMNIHLNDGSLNEYNLSEIDSITFSISPSDSIENGLVFGDFGITDSSFDYNSDWDEICQTVFGDDYRVADWIDLENYYSNGGDLLELFDSLSLINYRNGAFVKNNGVQLYSSSRGYFVERHEHSLPSGWLAHDNIDSYLISLGSWYNPKRIIVHKK